MQVELLNIFQIMSKCGQRDRELNIYSFMTTGQTPCAHEAHVMCLKAPELELQRLVD